MKTELDGMIARLSASSPPNYEDALDRLIGYGMFYKEPRGWRFESSVVSSEARDAMSKGPAFLVGKFVNNHEEWDIVENYPDRTRQRLLRSYGIETDGASLDEIVESGERFFKSVSSGMVQVGTASGWYGGKLADGSYFFGTARHVTGRNRALQEAVDVALPSGDVLSGEIIFHPYDEGVGGMGFDVAIVRVQSTPETDALMRNMRPLPLASEMSPGIAVSQKWGEVDRFEGQVTPNYEAIAPHFAADGLTIARPGFSGAPIVNERGEVVGVHVATVGTDEAVPLRTGLPAIESAYAFVGVAGYNDTSLISEASTIDAAIQDFINKLNWGMISFGLPRVLLDEYTEGGLDYGPLYEAQREAITDWADETHSEISTHLQSLLTGGSYESRHATDLLTGRISDMLPWDEIETRIREKLNTQVPAKKTELDGLITQLSGERVSAGFWNTVLEYIDSTLNFEGLLSPFSAMSDMQDSIDPSGGRAMSKTGYSLTQRDTVCPAYRDVNHRISAITDNLTNRGFSSEEIATIRTWTRSDFLFGNKSIAGKEVTAAEFQIPIEIEGEQLFFSFGDAIEFIKNYRFLCAPSLQDSIPNLIDSAKGFFSASSERLKRLQEIGANSPTKQALRDSVLSEISKEGTEDITHVY